MIATAATVAFIFFSCNKKLSEAELLKMAELIDEVSPKSAFKALDSELHKLSAAKKQK